MAIQYEDTNKIRRNKKSTSGRLTCDIRLSLALSCRTNSSGGLHDFLCLMAAD